LLLDTLFVLFYLRLLLLFLAGLFASLQRGLAVIHIIGVVQVVRLNVVTVVRLKLGLIFFTCLVRDDHTQLWFASSLAGCQRFLELHSIFILIMVLALFIRVFRAFGAILLCLFLSCIAVRIRVFGRTELGQVFVFRDVHHIWCVVGRGVGRKLFVVLRVSLIRLDH